MVNPIVQEYFEHGDTKEVEVNSLRFNDLSVCWSGVGLNPTVPPLGFTAMLNCSVSDAAEGAEPGPAQV